MIVDGKNYTYTVPEKLETIGDLRALINGIPDSVEMQDGSNQYLHGTLISIDGAMATLVLMPENSDEEE